MSYETKPICKILKVTDDDTGMYSCGDIEGSFDEKELESYLKTYGERGKTQLLETLAFLQFQVWNSWRNRSFEVDWSEDCQKYYRENNGEDVGKLLQKKLD